MGLPASSGRETARTAVDPLAPRRPRLNSARQRATQERHQFLLAPAGSARPLRRSTLPILLGSANVPESPWSARHPVRREYSPRRGEPLREKPVPFAIARSGLVAFDRSERLRHVRLPTQRLFESESRRY